MNRRTIATLGIVLAIFTPAILYAVAEVITRDSNQTPCPAIDDANSECRNLRYNATTKGLNVNVVGGAVVSSVTVAGTSTPTDAFANPTTAQLSEVFTMGWNGGTWDRFRTASAANLTTGTQTGSLIAEKGARWSVTHAPTVGLQATASITAGAAGVRHVADCISYSMGAAVAPTATNTTVVLRNGATGAGTIVWQKQLSAPASTGVHANESFCGLGIVGSAATAMTLEFPLVFGPTGLTNEIVTVNLTGYDVQ